MAIGTVVGFNPTRVATSAATLITANPCIVTARLFGGAAATLTLHNSASVTSAATTISKLSVAAANGTDEMGIPVRCDNGVKVKLSTIASGTEAYIYIR